MGALLLLAPMNNNRIYNKTQTSCTVQEKNAVILSRPTQLYLCSLLCCEDTSLISPSKLNLECEIISWQYGYTGRWTFLKMDFFSSLFYIYKAIRFEKVFHL